MANDENVEATISLGTDPRGDKLHRFRLHASRPCLVFQLNSGPLQDSALYVRAVNTHKPQTAFRVQSSYGFRRFTDLSITFKSRLKTAANYQKWDIDRKAIEVDELPIYYALETGCDKQVRRAWGRDKKLLAIA